MPRKRRRSPSSPKEPVVPHVLPTRERMRKDDDIVLDAPLDLAGRLIVRVETSTMLRRYYGRGHITKDQLDSGEWLGRLFRVVDTPMLRASSMEFRIPGPEDLEESENYLEAHERLALIYAKLERADWWLLYHVAALDMSAKLWARQRGHAAVRGIVMLRSALDVLDKIREDIKRSARGSSSVG